MTFDRDNEQVPNLETLARLRFSNLTEAEIKLLRAAPTGDFAVCSRNINSDDPANDPSKADEWGTDRHIQAALIRWLCVDRTARGFVDPRGIRAFGAKISGALDLSNARVPFGLYLYRCYLTDDANLIAVEIRDLDLQGTWTQSFRADAAKVAGSIRLQNGFHAAGEVCLARAEIGGDLDCIRATFRKAAAGNGIAALYADRTHVKGSVFLRNSLVEGEVRFLGAQIGADLDCEHATLRNPPQEGVPRTGMALNADRIKVTGSVLLRNGFSAEGEVNLLSAAIGINLECNDAIFRNPARERGPGSGKALNADGMTMAGHVLLHNGFNAEGEVNFLSAQIGNNLACDNSIFKNPAREGVSGTGKALNADRIKVAGYVFLRNGFSAEGEVNFLNAEIGSNLECDNSIFKNPARKGIFGTGKALNADRIKVAGYVFLRNGFSAEGEVNFLNAQIGSDLDCRKGTLKNSPKADIEGTSFALWADGSSVEGSVVFTEGFSAEGEVRLQGIHIGGDLCCIDAMFHGGLTAQTIRIKGALFWSGIREPDRTKLDLVNSSVGALVDDRASWPTHGNLRLDGFVYKRFSGQDSPRAWRDRLDWLARHKGFAPQPYRQLAKVLRDVGDDTGARHVLFAMERIRRQKEDRGRLARAWSGVLRCTVGYGYYPGRALWWLLALTLAGMALFWGGYSAGSVAPTEKESYSYFKLNREIDSSYESFSPLIYSLENSFPLVKLGQVDRWQPDPNPRWSCEPRPWLPYWLCVFLSPSFLRWFRWAQICLGWFFATMGVAAVAGIVRKE